MPTQPIIQTTLLFITRPGQVLLAFKKRGHGVNKWNGPGGKLDPGETPEQAAIRERQEEVGVTPLTLTKRAELHFYEQASARYVTHVYVCDSFTGDAVETEEMRPQWTDFDQIPYDAMWPDDVYWLPAVLAGRKLYGTFEFDGADQLTAFSITPFPGESHL